MEDNNAMADLYETMGKLIKKREEQNDQPELVRMKIIDVCNVNQAQLDVSVLLFFLNFLPI